jgi:PST family polysaccharide transporter/lipopolysaccharide exporter
MVTAVIKFPLIYFMAKYYGVIGIAVGFCIMSFITMSFTLMLTQYMVGSFMSRFLANFSKPALFSLAMAAVIVLYKHFIGDTGIVHTFLQIGLGGLVYGGLTLKYKLSWAEMKNLKGSA